MPLWRLKPKYELGRKTLSPEVYGSRYTTIYSIDLVHSQVFPYILTALPGMLDMSFTGYEFGRLSRLAALGNMYN
jgi:hypothetical protein